MIDMPLARNVDEEDGRHVMNTRGGLGPTLVRCFEMK